MISFTPVSDPQKGILGTGICQMFHKYKILLPLSECCLTYHIKVTFFAFWYQFWGKYPQNSMFDPRLSPKRALVGGKHSKYLCRDH